MLAITLNFIIFIIVICNQPCVHGYCYDINTCACDVGYTGDTCETIGKLCLF